MARSQRWVYLQDSLQLEWERVGVSFGVEQDFCFLFFPLLFCLSNLGGVADQKGFPEQGVQGSKQWVVSIWYQRLAGEEVGGGG